MKERDLTVFTAVCDYDTHFWPRKKRLYYVSWGLGIDYKRHRLRFCDEHCAIVEENLLEFEVGAQVRALRSRDRTTIQCFSCGKPVSDPCWQVFITGYPAQDERKDYWGGLHVDCALPEYLSDPELRTP